MEDIEHCCICGGPADYIQRTLCRSQFGKGWQELPAVYADKPYCVQHFFLLAEHTHEWTAQQMDRQAVARG